MLFSSVVVASLLGLLVASYADIRTREVPDWLNFSLIAVGFGTRLLFSLTQWNVDFLLEGLYGFGLGFLLAYVMFYSGQWGGGDSKMLMGLGALLGFQLRFDSFFVSFLINMLFIGAVYGFVWSIVLAIRNRRPFLRKVKEYTSKPIVRLLRLGTLAAVALCLVVIVFLDDMVFRFLLLVMALLVFLLLYVWVFVKAVEEACMLKYISPTRLTEGDWIAKQIKINGKYVCGPKDLGINKKQIHALIQLHKKNKVKRVLVKEGIPFVPSFLISFIITLLLGNLIFLFI